MAEALRTLGHEVAIARDGTDALRQVETLRPQVVLLDIGLPGMNGYEVAARLRRDPCAAERVLVALSGYGQPEDVRRAKQAGFDQHFAKPVDIDVLDRFIAASAGAPADAR